MALIIKDANGLVSLANKSDKWAVYNTKAAAEEALANDELAEGMMVGVVSTTDIPFNPDYSTAEIKTGAKWIDGKPIYRKVLTYSYGSSGGTSPVNIDISGSNIDSVVSMNGVALMSGTGISKSYAPIVAFLTSSSETVNGCQMYISEDKATFTFKAQGSGLMAKLFECTATIEYTKTTD